MTHSWYVGLWQGCRSNHISRTPKNTECLREHGTDTSSQAGPQQQGRCFVHSSAKGTDQAAQTFQAYPEDHEEYSIIIFLCLMPFFK